MHEVVHLAFGPQAAALNTQFYNQQQRYFVFNKEDVEKSFVDPSIHFTYGREYTPLVLFWDYKNGFGNQKQYRYDIENDSELPKDKIMLPINHRQWADYAEFPIHQNSMNKIPDWEIHPNNQLGIQRGAPKGQDEPFEFESFGKEQFSSACHLMAGTGEDYLDATFRPMLEKCDLLDGVNLMTDMGGWGGFSNRYLSILRDDYVTKKPIFSWALSRPVKKVPLKLQLSRVEILAEMSEFSSLVIPLVNKTDMNFLANAQAHLPTFESICLLSSMRKKLISMERIVQDLTYDLPNANFVQPNNSVLLEFKTDKPIMTRNKIIIKRPLSDARSDQIPLTLNVQSFGGRGNQTTVFDCPQRALDSVTECSFEINDRPLSLRKLVYRFGSHDLKELVGDLTDNYIWRWDSDSDSD